MLAVYPPIPLHDLIMESSLFRQLGLSEARAVAALGQERTFRAGEHLGIAGEFGESLYVIIDGIVGVPSLIGTGAVLLLTANDVYGVAALLDPHHYLATATAHTDCHVLALPTMAIHALMETNDSLGSRLFQEIARNAYQRLNEIVHEAGGRPIGNYLRA